MPAKFDVILPTYSRPELTQKCIESILKYSGEDFRLIWICNPYPGPEPNVETWSRHIYRLRPLENLGYTKSINAGLAFSTALYAVLLNSDTEVMTEGWLEKLAEGFVGAPKLGVIGPATDRPQQGLAGTLPKNTGLHFV